jgi:hypothetical protein
LIESQLSYMLLVGTFPFNGFLAGILGSLGFFSLTGRRRGSLVPALPGPAVPGRPGLPSQAPKPS